MGKMNKHAEKLLGKFGNYGDAPEIQHRSPVRVKPAEYKLMPVAKFMYEFPNFAKRNRDANQYGSNNLNFEKKKYSRDNVLNKINTNQYATGKI